MNARTKIRSSADVTKDIEALQAERQAAETRIQELDASWDTVLLKGTDDDAEKHQAERAKQDRIIARVALKLPPFEQELEGSKVHEAAEDLARRQAAATAAVDAVVSDKAVAEYEKAARTIVDFLNAWGAAEYKAKSAGVSTPSDRLRFRAGSYDPPSERTYVVYVDDAGRESPTPYVGAVQSDYTDENGVRYFGVDRHNRRVPIPTGKKVEKTRRVPGHKHPDIYCEDLLTLVRLPGIRMGDDVIWPPQEVGRDAVPQKRDAFGLLLPAES
jgi:hypothetical protein